MLIFKRQQNFWSMRSPTKGRYGIVPFVKRNTKFTKKFQYLIKHLFTERFLCVCTQEIALAMCDQAKNMNEEALRRLKTFFPRPSITIRSSLLCIWNTVIHLTLTRIGTYCFNLCLLFFLEGKEQQAGLLLAGCLFFINKVLLSHSHNHSFVYCLWLLSSYRGRGE